MVSRGNIFQVVEGGLTNWRRPCEKQGPIRRGFSFGQWSRGLFSLLKAGGYGSLRARLCEKSREPRKRRIVFSIAVSRPRLPVQLVSVSMKLRQMFYTQIERRTFHTAWVISAILTVVPLLPVFPQLQTCRCTALTDAMCTEAAIEPDLRLALAKPRFRWLPST